MSDRFTVLMVNLSGVGVVKTYVPDKNVHLVGYYWNGNSASVISLKPDTPAQMPEFNQEGVYVDTVISMCDSATGSTREEAQLRFPLPKGRELFVAFNGNAFVELYFETDA